MTMNDPRSDDPRPQLEGRRWGAIGLFIVGFVVVLALIVTLFGPTSTQQASNVPASPPANSQSDPPQPAQ
jgi:predicted PurR-regulated permease PerM